ncbi:hypothetical protein Plhal304r1_c051g0134741 [Plasmopara halstedii]
MEYIGSLCRYPDSKTKILLVLYSTEKQRGKYNLFKLLMSVLERQDSHALDLQSISVHCLEDMKNSKM